MTRPIVGSWTAVVSECPPLLPRRWSGRVVAADDYGFLLATADQPEGVSFSWGDHLRFEDPAPCPAPDPQGRASYACCYREGHDASRFPHRFVLVDPGPEGEWGDEANEKPDHVTESARERYREGNY